MPTGNNTTPPPPPPPPVAKDGIDFHSLPWNLNLPDEHSYVHLTTTSDWSKEHYDLATDSGKLVDNDGAVYSYADRALPMSPATTSLNYGTTIWEGLKCYRFIDEADGTETAVVFRPDRNFARMAHGAAELCLPPPSKELFLRAVQLAVQKNAHLIPPAGDGMKLYVRPMLLGSGQQLGLYPSPEFSFLVYVSPTGNYFKSATTGLNIHLETKRARAAVGGMGAVKCSGNYAVALKPLMDAKKQGFVDNLFLELDTYKQGCLKDAVIQEMSAANVFLVLRTGEIVTPALARGTILPGVTRESILELIVLYADELKGPMRASTGQDNVNVTVTARDVTIAELENASEVFATGTAAEMVPIARLATGEGEEAFDVTFPHGNTLPGGPVTTALLMMLRESMVGKREATKHWIRNPFDSPAEFCKYRESVGSCHVMHTEYSLIEIFARHVTSLE
jgi:branched-chain amino acid aminotransferase